MANHKVRALSHLEKTASTARVLNLRAIHRKNSLDPEYLAQPLFRNQTLNRAIIVKHRVRDNERYDFPGPKSTATKVIIPIDQDNLNAGGQYAFVGQYNFANIMVDTLNIHISKLTPDLDVLTLIDQCSSLDPFLLREHLSKQGITPAYCYFDVTESDNGKMLSFTKNEIAPLVSKSIGTITNEIYPEILSKKLLSDYSDESLDPLRLTLQMTPSEFREGIFCWKAFLYYKWQLQTLKPELPNIMQQISKLMARGLMDPFKQAYLSKVRRSLRRRMAGVLANIQDMIGVYDSAYLALIRKGDPMPFKQFLLTAPRFFNALGERLAAIEHVVSYWKHRTGATEGGDLMIDEVLEMFRDFDQSLSFDAVVD